jgi:hypothetical protein
LRKSLESDDSDIHPRERKDGARSAAPMFPQFTKTKSLTRRAIIFAPKSHKTQEASERTRKKLQNIHEKHKTPYLSVAIAIKQM